jgi:peptidyl-prolyl cis-trans isomerase B (cyclophilin B)
VSKANKRERQRQNREQRREYEEKLAKRRRLWKAARVVVPVVVVVLAVGAFLSLTNSDDSSSESSSGGCASVKEPAARDAALTAPAQTIDLNQAYSATIETTCGDIELSIDAQTYPISANNFVSLAQQGFYDDLAFVRAAKNFVVQTGSPDQTNAGGPGYTVQAEVPTTSPAYPVGTVAWAKNGTDPAGTIGSQFFIVTGTANANLPPDYAVIGKVTKGQNVAKRIEKLAPKSGDGALTKPVVMQKVSITTKGIVPSSTTTVPPAASQPTAAP